MISDGYLMELGPEFREMGLEALDSKSGNRNLNDAGKEDFCSKIGADCSGESGDFRNRIDMDFEISSDTSVCVSSRKRKRECDLRMLHWLLVAAKDPCNLGLKSLPESTKWKCYGNEHLWKQILCTREDMILKRDGDLSHTIWRTKQKMHPSMYDDYTGSQSLRSSKRLVEVKKRQKNPIPRPLSNSPSGPDSDSESHFINELSPFSVDSVLNLFGTKHKSVRVGTPYQANVPEYTEDAYVSESKWLGSGVWPLEKGESKKRHQIKKTRNGGKVQNICKCRNSRSDQCVEYHISIERKRLKLELGTAFDIWEFDKMGQQVSRSWTKEEEKRFQVIVESNPHSTGTCFWDEMFKSFPRKSRKDLVSYYFNVFVLQRRGLQNRSIGKEIDSDGEESQYGPLSNGFGRIEVHSPTSIFHSPMKAHI